MENEQQNGQQDSGKDNPPGVFIGVKVRRKASFCWPSGLIFPMLIVFIGVVYLLDQLGVLSAKDVFHYFWPFIFIYLGLAGVLFKSGPGPFWGWFMSFAGVFLVLNDFGIVHARWAIIWPLLVIFWGVWMLAQSMGVNTGSRGRFGGSEWVKNWRDRVSTTSGDSRSDISVVFSSLKRRITTKNFQGGKMSAIFGESILDLSDADMAGDEAVIHAEAVFGAHKIRVPRNWEVLARGSAVFGEFVDKTDYRAPEGMPAKRLIVNGSAVFGSVIIRD
jgi:predicted membrane protein